MQAAEIGKVRLYRMTLRNFLAGTKQGIEATHLGRRYLGVLATT
jgi:hypothetical protein